jgi:hypothetical protein
MVQVYWIRKAVVGGSRYHVSLKIAFCVDDGVYVFAV